MIIGLSALALGVVLSAIGLHRLKRRFGASMACIHEDECACYGAGYAAGKDKAHFELRHHVRANHAARCGCEPCRTLREIVAPVLLREAAAARGHVAHMLKAEAEHPEGTCDVCR